MFLALLRYLVMTYGTIRKTFLSPKDCWKLFILLILISSLITCFFNLKLEIVPSTKWRPPSSCTMYPANSTFPGFGTIQTDFYKDFPEIFDIFTLFDGIKNLDEVWWRDLVALPALYHKPNFGVSRNKVVGFSHCLPKALVLGKLESDIKFSTCLVEKSELKKKIDRLLHSRLEDRLNWQMMLAQNLLRDAGLDELKTEYEVEDLVKIADHLANYQIVVWTIDGDGRYVDFAIKIKLNPHGKQFIGLFYYEDQYESVDWRRGYPGYRFCYACSTYGVVLGHKIYCKPVCRKCGDKLGWRCVGIFCERCKTFVGSSS
ncbi:G_PROTEIN_RECEP_F1_2 domain-containing protein [Caenorhabditis elegans]|uniref:G_PROTEIN_RECEP_F1_2 domain-containing protein n=1 Tax=Caenorhabditis elegans TaxID=6239 RepID=O62077_CAEEL|nr:G_PROTEIN_RECEP_F1_2 domain-containing protein [Caenorhabditis elegans]CAB03921.3 G_PROTEIN_RECEP_F1_2 domain-containing protein [Caenorhabditis elegans]|eukprot:NP_001129882.2 Serpentine Receptor, class W [Caenorhabditis elegans]